MLLKRLLIGTLITLAGFTIIKYREKIQQWTGPIGFAEKYLGAGGTFAFIFLVGSILVIFAMLYITGAHQILLGKLTSGFGFK